MANTDKADTETLVLNDVQKPLKTLQLYRRAALGKKHLFATSTADAAEYFIVNPVPQKHHDTWRPILYKGDNPKYTSSKAIARARRTSMWNSFRLQVGDGVHEIMENKRRKKEQRDYRIGQKFRKWFCLGPTPPKKELEEQQEVEGLVFPLVSSDGTVIATLEKDRWATFRRSEKTGQPPNKKKELLGALRIYSLPECNTEDLQLPAEYEAAMNGEVSKKKKKETAKLNPKGPHSGNLTEEVIVFTCWIAVEGEHRLRYKVFDLLEEIAEYFKE
ncbi:hypothetical protein LRP88_05794 [Fusarium phalaenopsidis]